MLRLYTADMDACHLAIGSPTAVRPVWISSASFLAFLSWNCGAKWFTLPHIWQHFPIYGANLAPPPLCLKQPQARQNEVPEDVDPFLWWVWTAATPAWWLRERSFARADSSLRHTLTACCNDRNGVRDNNFFFRVTDSCHDASSHPAIITCAA
jgi:hypothetical protein